MAIQRAAAPSTSLFKLRFPPNPQPFPFRLHFPAKSLSTSALTSAFLLNPTLDSTPKTLTLTLTSGTTTTSIPKTGDDAPIGDGSQALISPPATTTIQRLLEVRLAMLGKQVQLLEAEIRQLCVALREIFPQQPILLEIKALIKICGDLRPRKAGPLEPERESYNKKYKAKVYKH